MRIILVLILANIVLISAGIYKGSKSVKVGKKSYKCSFTIVYSTSPPACGKKTAKCKPGIKKTTIKFPPIQMDDATITVGVSKNKVTSCKVDPSSTSSANPPKTTPGPESSDQLNCSCRSPLSDLPSGRAGRALQLTRMMLTANSRTGQATGRMCSPADNSLDRRFPTFLTNTTFQFLTNLVVSFIGLIAIPFTTLIHTLFGDRSLHLYPGLPGSNIEKGGEGFSATMEILERKGIKDFLNGKLAASLIKERMTVKNIKERNEALQENRVFHFTPILMILSIVIMPLISIISGLFGFGSRSLQLDDVAKEERERWQARILSLLKESDRGWNPFDDSSSSSSSSSEESSEESGEDGPGLGGFLGGFLGGALTESAGNVLDGILGEILGKGDFETDVNEIILKSWIEAITDNPPKMEELTKIGMDNGLEEQYIKGLIEAGDVQTLVDQLKENGADTEVINKVVENLANDFPGELEEAEEEIKNMDINMQCSCSKN